MDSTLTCPACGADWLGKPIPAEHQRYYGGKTHFRRSIAHTDRARDATVAYECPDCGAVFDRWSGRRVSEPPTP